ncbi:MAG: AAA family ATPase [Actinomycetota bacterium]|nr:AAA family ATPase [Actinomycetota bacterium]
MGYTVDMELAAFERAEPLATTHISRLVVAGDRVYKRKIAREFGFVDQRSLAARRHLCELEVQLNRRIVDDVYLGVEPLTDGAGEVVDYVVAMRRMPFERSLAARLAAGEPAEGCVRAVARLVADFHERALRSAAITAAGTREAVASLWKDSLDDLARLDEHVEPQRVAAIRLAANRYLDGRRPLFEARCRGGLVVDGHGDLLTPDIYCLDDGPRILDCLEFDERFRYGDVLLDVAFLDMDLRWRGRPDLAIAFIDAYQELSDEHHPSTLLAHFVAYRALVRAKVALYRAIGGDPSARADAESLFGLVEERLAAGAIRLVMIGGLPGTGKSTLAEALSAHSGWMTINTDTVRHELGAERSSAPWGQGAYAPDVTAQTYDLVMARARTALGLGESVIIDASFRDEANRAAVRDLGRALSASVVELRCQAPAALADARLLARDASNPSDATPAIAARMAESFAAWPEATTIDSARPVDESVGVAVAATQAAPLDP